MAKSQRPNSQSATADPTSGADHRPQSGHAPLGALPSGPLASLPFIAAIRLYQAVLGPLMGGHCRFEPTCSQYALDAYRLHGPIRGTWLTARRILRCHPLGGSGYDPVPPRR